MGLVIRHGTCAEISIEFPLGSAIGTFLVDRVSYALLEGCRKDSDSRKASQQKKRDAEWINNKLFLARPT
jgi:hypothetical protein